MLLPLDATLLGDVGFSCRLDPFFCRPPTTSYSSSTLMREEGKWLLGPPLAGMGGLLVSGVPGHSLMAAGSM